MVLCLDCVLFTITLLPCEKLHQHLDFLPAFFPNQLKTLALHWVFVSHELDLEVVLREKL